MVSIHSYKGCLLFILPFKHQLDSPPNMIVCTYCKRI